MHSVLPRHGSIHYFYAASRALCVLIHTGPCRQVLGVRAVDACEVGLTAGSAVNLLAVDAQRLMDTAGSLHELWGLPFQVLRR